MAVEVSDLIRENLKDELSKIEKSSDLSQMTILSRSGMKIATANSSAIDADPITASSAALIDVGIKFIGKIEHGDLKEILVRGKSGYAILQHIDSNFLIFAGLTNLSRIGFYLEYLRTKCKRFSYILSGGKISTELQEQLDLERQQQQGEEPSIDELFKSDVSDSDDLNAMQDVLSFLDDWGGEEATPTKEVPASGIVGIEEDFMIKSEIIDEIQEPIEETVKKPTDNFPIYEGEVPPIPLEDVEALEIHTEQQSLDSEDTIPKLEPSIQSPGITMDFPEGEVPNFEDFSANEYADFDLDLSEEEVMFEALADLGYTDDKKKKKKQNDEQ